MEDSPLRSRLIMSAAFLSKARLTISEISGDSLFRFFLIFVKYYLVDMKSLNSGNN